MTGKGKKEPKRPHHPTGGKWVHLKRGMSLVRNLLNNLSPKGGWGRKEGGSEQRKALSEKTRKTTKGNSRGYSATQRRRKEDKESGKGWS